MEISCNTNESKKLNILEPFEIYKHKNKKHLILLMINKICSSRLCVFFCFPAIITVVVCAINIVGDFSGIILFIVLLMYVNFIFLTFFVSSIFWNLSKVII